VTPTLKPSNDQTFKRPRFETSLPHSNHPQKSGTSEFFTHSGDCEWNGDLSFTGQQAGGGDRVGE
jgi:hypothetical protein